MTLSSCVAWCEYEDFECVVLSSCVAWCEYEEFEWVGPEGLRGGCRTGCLVRWVRVPEGDVSVCVGSVCDSGVIYVCCLVSVWNVLSECT